MLYSFISLGIKVECKILPWHLLHHCFSPILKRQFSNLYGSAQVRGRCDQSLKISDLSSSGSADSIHTETRAIDGDANTFWMSTKIIHPYIILHPEGSQRKICRVDIRWQDSQQYYFRISLGSSAGTTMDVYSGKSSGNPNIVEKYEFYEQTCTFVQITVTESDPGILPKCQANISEITVYGKGTN